MVSEWSPPPGDAPLALGIGIDYGRVLLVSGKDCFGDAVNIAHKLSISGLEIPAYRVLYANQ